MSVTTTSLGSYSTQITLSNETSSTNFITALDAAIVAGGWTQYDVFANGTQRVYRCLNKDAVTYKYIHFFIDIATWKLSTSCFETWNATTHVGTNETITFSRVAYSGYSLYGSDILLMVSNRWCIIQTFIRGEVSPWSGVIEIQRESAEDTAAAGYPCFAWVGSSTILTNNPSSAIFQMVSFPRSRGNLTGLNAVATGLQTPYVRLGGSASSSQLNNYVAYSYDTTKRIVHSLRPAIGNTEIHGRISGLKAMYNVGSPYSTLNINVDSDFNCSSTGPSTPHWVLGATVPQFPNVMLAAGPSSNGYMTLTSSVIPGIPVTVGAAYTGKSYYVGSYDTVGMAKFDASPSLPLITASIPGTSGVQMHDVVYDGRYVYASTPTGILRVDTIDDSVTNISLTNGTTCLYFDSTYLWAGARGTRSNNTVYKIDISSFSLLSTTIVTSATTSIGGITSDLNGNLYIVTNEVNLYKLVTSTGILSSFASVTSACSGANVIYDGTTLIVGAYTAAPNARVAYVTLAGAVTLLAATSLANGAVLGTKISLCKIGHVVVVGGYVTAGTASHASSYLPGFPVLNTGFGPIGGVGATSVQCDGNRIIATGNQGQLFLYTNINHPDDANTLHGRLVLPK